MQAPRLNEVLARVVAWHNRHPLARRISASQVHSIGEVVLPFASAQPAAPPPPPPAHLPTIEELLAAEAIPPEVATFDELVRRAAHPDTPPAGPSTADAPATTPAQADALGDDGAEAALEMPLPGDDAAVLGPELAADADAASAAATEEAEADVALAEAPEQAPAAPPVEADAPSPGATGLPDLALDASVDAVATASAAALAGTTPAAPTTPAWAHPGPPAVPATAGSLWARLRARLPGGRGGLPRLQAAFSEDFLWPLSPARIARWARRHGQPQALAPADWPRRVIATDPRRLAALRQRGLGHNAPLHLLTAAIGVGDRRIRVLLAPDGAVLGPRAYSRPALALAGGLLAAALLAGGWGLRHWAEGPTAAAPAPAAAAAATVAAAPASAASAEATAAAPATASAADDAAPAPAASAAAAIADPTHQAVAPAGAAASALATAPAFAPAAAPAASVPVSSDTASAPRADIRPQLSDEARRAARAEAAALRGEPPPPPPAAAPVYAVVSPPQARREAAARAQALMQAAGRRLPPPAPEHAELMQQPGGWRAAWWPFASLADAERARVLLAGRGLKAEVVEF